MALQCRTYHHDHLVTQTHTQVAIQDTQMSEVNLQHHLEEDIHHLIQTHLVTHGTLAVDMAVDLVVDMAVAEALEAAVEAVVDHQDPHTHTVEHIPGESFRCLRMRSFFQSSRMRVNSVHGGTSSPLYAQVLD